MSGSKPRAMRVTSWISAESAALWLQCRHSWYTISVKHDSLENAEVGIVMGSMRVSKGSDLALAHVDGSCSQHSQSRGH